VRVAGDHVDVLDVAIGGAMFPRVGTDDFFLFPLGLAIPDERYDARIFHALHGDRLGLVEGL
jgi:hypothetical protein